MLGVVPKIDRRVEWGGRLPQAFWGFVPLPICRVGRDCVQTEGEEGNVSQVDEITERKAAVILPWVWGVATRNPRSRKAALRIINSTSQTFFRYVGVVLILRLSPTASSGAAMIYWRQAGRTTPPTRNHMELNKGSHNLVLIALVDCLVPVVEDYAASRAFNITMVCASCSWNSSYPRASFGYVEIMWIVSGSSLLCTVSCRWVAAKVWYLHLLGLNQQCKALFLSFWLGT